MKMNLCNNIYKGIKNISGLKSNSASPTDTWILNFNPDVTYDNIHIKTCFLKIFIDQKDLFTPFDL